MTSATTMRRRFAAAAVLGVLLASGPAAASAPATTQTPVARALDTSSRKAVNEAYWDTWVPAAQVRPGWTGSVRGCRRGHDSDRHRKATQRAVNFARSLAGLTSVTMSEELGRKALAAALIMDAEDKLSHAPPKSWRCWTKAGRAAAGRSNLHLQWGFPVTVGSVLGGYLDDPGSWNTAVGHRRWLLYPRQEVMGTGSTAQANALYVFGTWDEDNPAPAYVGWPSAGWFPNPLEPGGRWSLSAGDEDADLSDATVRVVRLSTGAELDITQHPVQTGMGLPTVAWEMPAKLDLTDRYEVRVTGIVPGDGGSPTSTSYVVRLFKPKRD